MKNNIFYIGGFSLPDKNAAAQRVMANGRLFMRSGYNVHFIDVQTETEKITSETFIKKNFEGFKYFVKSRRYPKTARDWFLYLTGISFIKKEIREGLKTKPDIIVVYNYPAISLLRLYCYCKKNNIKLIADVTEWYLQQGPLHKRILQRLDSFLRMQVLHEKLDGLIVISTFLEQKYQRSKIIRLPPLVNKKSAKWKVIPNSNLETGTLIYVGSISHGEKDRLDLIINSLSRIKSRVKDLKFKIFGVTKKEYLRYFGNESLPKNFTEFLFFMGKREHNEVVTHLKKADYSIFFRENNLLNTAGFPTKFVESLACGTPVITNSSSDISKYFIQGKTGYIITSFEEKQLDECLYEILTKKKYKLLEMKKSALNYDKFHYEEYLDKFNKFLVSI